MKALAIIPARAQSTRLPGKPLEFIGDKTVIQRVWEQCSKASCFEEVHVATDSEQIAEAVSAFGGSAMMTGNHHKTGTDRVAEAYSLLKGQGKEFDCIANVQGDLPFIGPEAIEATVASLRDAPETFGMGTVAVPIFDIETFQSPHSVKIALGEDERALYFSRAPIPYPRASRGADEPLSYHHFGLYVFRPDALLQITRFEQSLCEEREQLEQLRALAHGISIRVAIVAPEDLGIQIEINTYEDLEAANRAVQG